MAYSSLKIALMVEMACALAVCLWMLVRNIQALVDFAHRTERATHYRSESNSKRLAQLRILASFLGLSAVGSAYVHFLGDDSTTTFCDTTFRISAWSYCWAKAALYLVLFTKSRLVRPLEQKFSIMEWLALAGSIAVFPFGVISGALTGGEVDPLETVFPNACVGIVPIELSGALLPADFTLSLIYLYLFVQPVRQLTAATKRDDQIYTKLVTRNLVLCACAVCMTFIFLLLCVVTDKALGIAVHNRSWLVVVGMNDVACSVVCVAYPGTRSSGAHSGSTAGGPGAHAGDKGGVSPAAGTAVALQVERRRALSLAFESKPGQSGDSLASPPQQHPQPHRSPTAPATSEAAATSLGNRVVAFTSGESVSRPPPPAEGS